MDHKNTDRAAPACPWSPFGTERVKNVEKNQSARFYVDSGKARQVYRPETHRQHVF